MVRRWLEASRCSAKVGLRQGWRNGPREVDSGRRKVVRDLLMTRCGGTDDAWVWGVGCWIGRRCSLSVHWEDGRRSGAGAQG